MSTRIDGKVLFTCTEPTGIKHFDPVDGVQINLDEGETKFLRPELIEYFCCSLGWGTAEGFDSCERQPGSHRVQPNNSKQLV